MAVRVRLGILVLVVPVSAAAALQQRKERPGVGDCRWAPAGSSSAVSWVTEAGLKPQN